MLTYIYILIFINFILGLFYLNIFAKSKSPIGFFFVLTWIMHYVIGNIFLLIESENIFFYIKFGEIELYYLYSSLVGTYFLIIYSTLLRGKRIYSTRTLVFSQKNKTKISIIYITGIICMLIFIAKVGIDSYFSIELAFYRSMLGDYVSGIGFYYYIGMMLIPATLLILSYLITYPNLKNILLIFIIIIISSILLVPLGGRGRVINLILIIFISYLIPRENFSLKKILSFRIILLFVFISLISIIWSNLREKNEYELNIASISIIGGLATDMTRLQTQSFIFSKYPISGIYFGETYLSGLLGPTAKYISFFTSDYLSKLSSDWYFESIGAIDLKSAISPSFIGEIYMNFGFLGIILSPFFFFIVINIIVNLLRNEHALSKALVIYYFQFSFFHGGLYMLFDMLLTTVPLFLLIKYFTINIESKTIQYSKNNKYHTM